MGKMNPTRVDTIMKYKGVLESSFHGTAHHADSSTNSPVNSFFR
jgi:hypothetical protein